MDHKDERAKRFDELRSTPALPPWRRGGTLVDIDFCEECHCCIHHLFDAPEPLSAWLYYEYRSSGPVLAVEVKQGTRGGIKLDGCKGAYVGGSTCVDTPTANQKQPMFEVIEGALEEKGHKTSILGYQPVTLNYQSATIKITPNSQANQTKIEITAGTLYITDTVQGTGEHHENEHHQHVVPPPNPQ